MQASLADLLKRIPGTSSAQWPDGERYAQAFAHGTMSVGYYAPVGVDPQQPHKRDEVYIVHRGTGVLVIDRTSHAFNPGDVFFVGAGTVHRFEKFSADFATWVVFWGPEGGETN
ncbi:MAG: cupin domain-containing protein [Rudaea sp.]